VYLAGVWLPLLTSSLFYLKRQALSDSLAEVARYVMKLEDHFRLPDDLGYEHHLKSSKAAHFKKWRTYYWAILVGTNTLLAIILLILKA
jgi:hypothetical protein